MKIMDCNIFVIILPLILSLCGDSLPATVLGTDDSNTRTIRDSESRSRSIKTSLDQVLREVKLKLKNIFSSPNVKIEKESRLIKTPIEAILPESWFIDDHDFYHLKYLPRDVEIQIEDLNRRWERGNVIADIDRESFMKPRKTRVRKKQKLKTKFLDKRNQTSHKPESKIYFTQIIKDRPVEVNDRKLSKRRNENSQEINDTTDMLDSYSPYIYAELLKENKTNFVLIDDLTDNNINATESVIVNEIEVYDNTDIIETETTESDPEVNMVTLEVAVVDSIDLLEQESNNSDDFLPFIPPSAGIDFETEYDLTVIGEAAQNESQEIGDQTPFSRQEHQYELSLKPESWAFTGLVVSGCLLCLLLLYECSVLFSVLAPLSLSSHCLVMSLSLSTISALLLTLSPNPVICTSTQLLAPLSYTAIFSCLLLKIIFLVILGREEVLTRGHQAGLLTTLVLVQLSVSAYLLVTSPPDVRLTQAGEFRCELTFEEGLHGHLYSVLVLAITVTLWLRCPDTRNMFTEAQAVGITALLSGPVWLSWVVAGLSLDTRYQDLCSYLGIQVTVVLTFLLMFVVIRIRNDNSGFSDCYQHAKKYPRFSIIPFAGSRNSFFQIFGSGSLSGSLSHGNLLEDNIKNIHDLSKAVQDSVTSASSGSDGESEPALDTETSKPYAGYRRTNSFDRFPFMSRPLRSAGRPGPGAGSSVPQGTGVQSLSNPNVLFCTPQDIRRATLSRY